jgi:hypothetical protein
MAASAVKQQHGEGFAQQFLYQTKAYRVWATQVPSQAVQRSSGSVHHH